MKIIFSRKGFDSRYGGGCSPIMPDGRLISIPIPKGEADICGTPYEHIYIDKKMNCLELMEKLNLGIPPHKKAHLDPDIRKSAKDREKDWKGVFGQDYAAQGHLKNQDVKEGDLFLFFGSFKETDKKLKFKNTQIRHMIFGYLRIGEITDVSKIDEADFLREYPDKSWLRGHPHLNRNNKGKNNCIYIAADFLTNSKEKPGFGVFLFNNDLVLTERDQCKSRWELESFFHKDEGCNMSRHSKDIRWRKENGKTILDTVGIGQEFVIQDNKNIESWAINLIKKSITYQ